MFNGPTQEVCDGPKESQKHLNALSPVSPVMELRDAFEDVLCPFVVFVCSWVKSCCLQDLSAILVNDPVFVSGCSLDAT